jgi:hypothetical protein
MTALARLICHEGLWTPVALMRQPQQDTATVPTLDEAQVQVATAACSVFQSTRALPQSLNLHLAQELKSTSEIDTFTQGE